MKRFIDDIANEVIEEKLISPLGGIFTPITVSTMSADLVTSLAGESEEGRAQREQLDKQLDVLKKGSETCQRFIGVRLLGKMGPCLTCLVECLPIYSGGADDDTAQSSPSLDNDSVVCADGDAAQSGPGSNNDADEVPEAIFDFDVRSLTDRSLKPRYDSWNVTL